MATFTGAGFETVVASDLDHLIGSLRIHFGDTTSPYTFTDEFLRRALVDGFKALTIRWQSRYTLTVSGTLNGVNYTISGLDFNQYSITRNTEKWLFTTNEPPTILIEDERPIILAAAIIISEGIINKNSGKYVSWRDDEISFSNLESGRTLKELLQSDKDELESILPSRAKKLARTRKQSLLGFTTTVGNYFEGE